MAASVSPYRMQDFETEESVDGPPSEVFPFARFVTPGEHGECEPDKIVDWGSTVRLLSDIM